ncbi:MAG: hypothetical protein ACTSRU_15960 [Candidatus Hodarchaeales archaeon]
MRRDPVFTGIFPDQESGEEVLIISLKQFTTGIYEHPCFQCCSESVAVSNCQKMMTSFPGLSRFSSPVCYGFSGMYKSSCLNKEFLNIYQDRIS